MSLVYKVPSYQSIFDALVTIEVPLDSIVSVMSSSDLNFDEDISGETVLYQQTQIEKPKGGQIAVPVTTDQITYFTTSNQNLFDICLMTLGDLNKVVSFTRDNNFNNINAYPDGVLGVTYNNSNVTDSGFKLALRKAGINIETGGREQDVIEYLLQENGFFILQEDGFKIILG